ncbi:MAG: hypothetical protein LUC89_00230 [Oscillospiraceae bacterium]|nr:hypothetical protein [Oscillospiraceae bacterium]
MKRAKAIISGAIAMLLLFGCVCVGVYAEEAEELPLQVMETASEFAGGDGSEADPYQIETPQQLMLFAACCLDWEMRGCSFILTDDIVFNDVDDISLVEDLSSLYGWESTGYYFSGTFDGNGHFISGLYIYPNTDTDSIVCGFIGDADGAVVRNLSIVNSCVDTAGIESVDYIGAIVAEGVDTVIENCSSDAAIRCDGLVIGYVGGIAGFLRRGSAEKCVFTGSIAFHDCASADVGGIVGFASGLDVISCIADCVFSEGENAPANIGGIIGYCQPGPDSVISDCVSYSDISVAASSLGGIVNTISLDQYMEYNGDAGMVYQPSSLRMESCRNDGDLYTEEGIISYTPSGGLVGEVLSPYDREVGPGSLVMEGCENNGAVTGVQCVGGVIGQISSAYGMVTVSGCVNNGAITGKSYVGGIVGQADPSAVESTLSGCANHGAVYASNAAVGGIMGSYGIFSLYVKAENCVQFAILDCVNDGDVSNEQGILGTGGILGLADTLTDTTDTLLLSGCVNYGDVQGSVSGHLGGILGTSEGTLSGGVVRITGCGNSGSIILGDGAGELTSADDVLDGYTAEESALLMVGSSAVGGIVGCSRLCVITDCVNIGALYLDSETIAFGGGICGLYMFIPDDDFYTAETSGIADCICVEGVAAYGIISDWGEETIANVTVLSEEEAQSAFAALAG